jgi:hypothetical protein
LIAPSIRPVGAVVNGSKGVLATVGREYGVEPELRILEPKPVFTLLAYESKKTPPASPRTVSTAA